MCYYYYKGDEKIGPVDSDEILHLAEWGDITPATIIEKNNGNQVSASDIVPDTYFWTRTNRLGIPLDAARRRVTLCNNVKLLCLLGQVLCGIVIFVASCAKNISLQIIFYIAVLVMTGLIVWAEYYQTKKLGKVPPKPKED